MRTALLASVAAVLILASWLAWLDANLDREILPDEITSSGAIVVAASIASSLAFWLLFSLPSRRYGARGAVLCVITGASLSLPFYTFLSPAAGMIVGAVAGFSASRLQRRMDDPPGKRPMKIAAMTLASSFLGLVAIGLASHNPPLWEGGFSPWLGWGPIRDSGPVLLVYADSLVALLISAASLSATALLVRTRG